MILPLLFLLDISFDKHIVFEIMVLIGKKLFKPSEKLSRKLCIYLIVKKPPKLDEQMRKKTE